MPNGIRWLAWVPSCTLTVMRSLLEDLRYGMRMLRASPGLTVTAVLTLALGIAANTTVFGWINGVLLDPIPGAAHPSQLASLETLTPKGELENTSYRDFRDYRDNLRQVSGAAASLLNVFTVGPEQSPRLLWGEFVSANYFSVMGVNALRGRTFLASEGSDAPGGPPVVAISDRLWQSLYNRDPRAIGRTLRVNQHELTIVGVIPAKFYGAVPGLMLEMWIPMSLAPELNGQGSWLLDQRGSRQVWITARLRPGVRLEQARAEVGALARRIAETSPDSSRGYSATLLPIWQGHLGAQQLLRKPLQILMAVCLVLFLIVAANVSNLQLARAAVRQKEFGIRQAMGAQTRRLVRQLLTESLLLAAIGSAFGALLVMWSGQALAWLLPPTDLPFELAAPVNGHVLAFTIFICVLAAALTGVAPALHSIRSNVVEDLKDNSRGSTAGRSAGRTRSVLVVSEVALATVALVGTGVLTRNFFSARALDSGMDTHHVACAKYYLETFCRGEVDRRQFCSRLTERLRAIPGVRAVGYTNNIPLEFGNPVDGEISVDGYVPAPGESMRVAGSSVSPGYFDALGIPFVQGRDFRDQDQRGAAPVLIVNQAFQRRYFGTGTAVGRKVRGGSGPAFTIVGVVRDAKYRQLTESPIPFVYSSTLQFSGGEFWMAFFVRTVGPVAAMAPILRREAAAVNPATRGSGFENYDNWLEAALYSQRVAATLVGVVGGVCLLLSAIGLYSVLAFAVRQRTHEFGIRIALGGRPHHVFVTMLRKGMGLTLAGLAAGAVIALAVLKAASAVVGKLKSDDPLVFAAAILLLSLVAFLASYLPARRATKVDPMVALRHE